MDPLARLGRQLVSAAELRAVRRRRRRTVLAVSTTTLALSGAIGVAAIQIDIVGPTSPPQAPLFAPDGSARINLQVGANDETWTTIVYRNVSAGICITAPTNAMRTDQVGCGSANITAEELAAAPVTSTRARTVGTGGSVDTVIVFGLARPDVERVDFPGADGERIERSIDGETLDVPIHLAEPDGYMLTVRPFAVLATVEPGAKTMPMIVHTSDGGGFVAEVRVEPAAVRP